MAVALQVLTADQLQEVARSLDVPHEAICTGGGWTVPAKWKVVLRYIRDATGADVHMVAALDDAAIERLYRRIAWKMIMQQLIDEIYAKNTAVVESMTPASHPPEHGLRRNPRLQSTGAVPEGVSSMIDTLRVL